MSNAIEQPILYLGYYRIQDWSCPRYYYHQHIEKIEKNVLNVPFMVGRIVPHGIREVYKGSGKAVETVRDKFNEELKWVKKTFKGLNEETEQDVNEIKFIVMGMMEGYQRVYAKRISKYKLGENEVKFEYEIMKGVKIRGSIDNFLIKKGGEVLHELKTTARLTPAYVKRIQTDLQTAIYYYLPRKIKGFKFKATEILYDVIRKPQIRQKQSETYKQFLKRLSEWYVSGKEQNIFYSETNEAPLISEHNMMNTLVKVASEIQDATENAECYPNNREKRLDQFRQNFDMCFRQDFECQFYDLCHRVKDEKDLKVVMVDFKQKEKFRQ